MDKYLFICENYKDCTVKCWRKKQHLHWNDPVFKCDIGNCTIRNLLPAELRKDKLNKIREVE